jgi:thiamine biosynthesis lipoprotein
MGTVVSFSIREARTTDGSGGVAAANAGAAAAAGALERARATLIRADEVFSTWKPDSPVSRLRRGEIGLDEAPPEVADVLELCARARDASDGWFDPWMMPGGLDPTGLVKGWATERALDEFKEAGVPAAMINAGGDIAVYGQPETGQPWRIGIRHPLAADRLLLMVELEGPGAVATSGAYERGEHLFDPHTGAPVNGLLAATVIGHDLAFADALATALFVSDGELLDHISRLAGYHGFIVDGRGVIRASRGLPAALKIAA